MARFLGGIIMFFSALSTYLGLEVKYESDKITVVKSGFVVRRHFLFRSNHST